MFVGHEWKVLCFLAKRIDCRLEGGLLRRKNSFRDDLLEELLVGLGKFVIPDLQANSSGGVFATDIQMRRLPRTSNYHGEE